MEGLPSLPCMSPGLPAQLLHPHHSPTGRARLVQPTTTRRESRQTRSDRQFPRPPINSMAKNEGNLDDRNYPYSRLRAVRRRRRCLWSRRRGRRREMSLDRSLSQKRLRTSARCRWIETPSDVAERCWGGLLQFRNVGLSHRGVCGMMFGQITTILSHWFKKRRSLASGISATGSSLGETIIPVVSS